MKIKEELEIPDEEESDVIEAGAPEVEEEPLSNEEYVSELLTRARSAASPLSILTASAKNQALEAMAEGLEEATDIILEANEEDIVNFGDDPGRAAMADRLKLTPERIAGMAKQIREIAALRDPVGESLAFGNDPMA